MASSERPHLIIGICTFRRPEMLRRCLASVLAQECPEGWKVEIVVVDNDAQSDLAEMISRAFPDPKYPIRYFIEPRRGIPHARNAVCRHALSVQADLIAFIDDDEEADPGWLMAYARGMATYEAQAYTGPVRYIFPPGYEDWLANKGFAETKHGALLKRAATANVMFRTSVLGPEGEPLQFDTNMALTGGSDTDFFMRLVHQGGRIVYLSDAVVSEAVVPNRLTIRWRLKRQYRSSANRVYIESKLFGAKKTARRAVKELVRHGVEGTLRLVFSPVMLLGGYRKFKRSWYHGLRHFAKAGGIIAGLRGRQVQPYRQTDGY